MATSVERRRKAIRAIVDYALPDPRADVVLVRRADLIARIEPLATLGRTDRWRGEVERWADLVSTEPLRWAVTQGAIYAAYAAD